MTKNIKILLTQKDKFIFAFLFALFFVVSLAEGSSLVLKQIFPSHTKEVVSSVVHISSAVDAPIEDFVFEEYDEDETLSLFRIFLRTIFQLKYAQVETHISNHAFEHFTLVVHPPFYDLFCNWKAFIVA
jgi:hypothetical protein